MPLNYCVMILLILQCVSPDMSPLLTEEEVSAGVQLAFASMLGETAEEDTLSYVDDEDDEDYTEERVKVELEVAGNRSRRGRKGGKGKEKGHKGRKDEEEEEEENEDEGDPSVGDVFALEMELNRENKKMMRVRRRWRGGGGTSVSLFATGEFLTCRVFRSGAIAVSFPEL